MKDKDADRTTVVATIMVDLGLTIMRELIGQHIQGNSDDDVAELLTINLSSFLSQKAGFEND